MDREILFRGKRLDNGEWVEGNLFIPDKITRTDVPTEILMGTNLVRISYEVDSATVGQYTGLTGKNGKKIFEGDIVKLHDRNGDWIAKVVFGNPNGFYNWGWQLSYISGADGYNKDILLWVDMEDIGVTCKVIGNVFDNPELLEA